MSFTREYVKPRSIKGFTEGAGSRWCPLRNAAHPTGTCRRLRCALVLRRPVPVLSTYICTVTRHAFCIRPHTSPSHPSPNAEAPPASPAAAALSLSFTAGCTACRRSRALALRHSALNKNTPRGRNKRRGRAAPQSIPCSSLPPSLCLSSFVCVFPPIPPQRNSAPLT